MFFQLILVRSYIPWLAVTTSYISVILMTLVSCGLHAQWNGCIRLLPRAWQRYHVIQNHLQHQIDNSINNDYTGHQRPQKTSTGQNIHTKPNTGHWCHFFPLKQFNNLCQVLTCPSFAAKPLQQQQHTLLTPVERSNILPIDFHCTNEQPKQTTKIPE